jgi:hypothetical protein
MIFLKYFTVLFCCSISRGEMKNLILTNAVLSLVNVAGNQYRLHLSNLGSFQLSEKEE